MARQRSTSPLLAGEVAEITRTRRRFDRAQRRLRCAHRRAAIAALFEVLFYPFAALAFFLAAALYFHQVLPS